MGLQDTIRKKINQARQPKTTTMSKQEAQFVKRLEKLDAKSNKKITVIKGDYEYTRFPNELDKGWHVNVIDKDKTEYEPIKSRIRGIPVTSIQNAFKDCKNMTVAPEIPSSVIEMRSAFYNCISLTTAPVIPNSVKYILGAFRGCTSLTTPPKIPNSVTEINNIFKDCTSLTIAPKIPDGVTNMDYMFSGCTSLTTAPVIPNSVKAMNYTFQDCKNLTIAPELPKGVEKSGCFDGCTKLQSQSQTKKIDNIINYIKTGVESGELTPMEFNPNNSFHPLARPLGVVIPENIEFTNSYETVKATKGQVLLFGDDYYLMDGPTVPKDIVFKSFTPTDKSCFDCVEKALNYLQSSKTPQEIMAKTIETDKNAKLVDNSSLDDKLNNLTNDAPSNDTRDDKNHNNDGHDEI